jgi:hypothetical protein
VEDLEMLKYIVERIDADKEYSEEQRIAAEYYFEKVPWAANKRSISLPDFYYGIDGSKEIIRAIENRKLNLTYERNLLRADFQRWCLAKEKEYIAMYSTEEFKKVEEMRDQYFLEKLKLEISLKDANARANKLAEENFKLKEKCDKLMNDASNSQDYINLEKRNAELEKMLEIERNMLAKANQKLNEFQTVEM